MDEATKNTKSDSCGIEVGDVVRHGDGPLREVLEIDQGLVGYDGGKCFIDWSHPEDLKVWHSWESIEREFEAAYQMIKAEKEKYKKLKSSLIDHRMMGTNPWLDWLLR